MADMSVAVQLSKEFRDTVKKNRQTLRSIVDTIIFVRILLSMVIVTVLQIWKVKVHSQTTVTSGLCSTLEYQLATLT